MSSGENKMIRVAVISGGAGLEHNISMISAYNILQQLDSTLFEAVWIVANKQHEWFLVPQAIWPTMKECITTEHLIPLLWRTGGYNLPDVTCYIDVAFPIMHGTYGEDGHVQGLLTMLNIPFAGCGVMSSVLGMHKHLFKIMMQAHNIPVLPYYLATSHNIAYSDVQKYLQCQTLFVKPSASGSSVGAMKVVDESAWHEALVQAFAIDEYVIIEPFLEGVREVECALWAQCGIASTLGEISVQGGFYDYDNKYVIEDNVTFTVPAIVDEDMTKKIQQYALHIAQLLGIKEYARVDFFIDGTSIYVNEINTLPGFTAISMFPRLLAHDGYSTQYVLSRLIMQAYEEAQNPL